LKEPAANNVDMSKRKMALRYTRRYVERQEDELQRALARSSVTARGTGPFALPG